MAIVDSTAQGMEDRMSDKLAAGSMIAAEGITAFLTTIDDQMKHPDESAHRWAKAIREMTGGYQDDPKQILSTAVEIPVEMSEPISLCGIQFVSVCSHHLMPFIGIAHVSYLPRVVGEFGSKQYRHGTGLSKLARLVDCFARRFQIQEQITQQIIDALLDKPLQADWAAVQIEASHSCMTCRGVGKPGATMITTSWAGGGFLSEYTDADDCMKYFRGHIRDWRFRGRPI